MSRRSSHLTTAAVSLILILTASGVARAHAVHVGFRVRAARQVEVRAWFSADEPMKGAEVAVTRVGGGVLALGMTDDRGTCTFTIPDETSVEVTLSDRKGHGGKFTITAEAVVKASDGRLVMLSDPTLGDDPVTLPGERGESFPLREVILGVTFLMAAAAFAISVRNAQAIKRIQESPKPPPA